MEATTEPRKKDLVTPSGLKVEFRHEKGNWPQEVRIGGKKKEITVSRRTICEVKVGSSAGLVVPESTVVTRGEAYCSPSDNFEYELGRQYALLDACARLDRQRRKEVMETYLGRPGAQPWRLDKDGHLKHTRAQISTEMKLSVADSLANLLKVVATA